MSELKNDEVLKKSADRIQALLDAINIKDYTNTLVSQENVSQKPKAGEDSSPKIS